MEIVDVTIQRIRAQFTYPLCDRPSPPLVRRFVETGEERCPIAGTWMVISPEADSVDESESIWPAVRRLLSWRAFHSPLTLALYRHSYI
jgi:hypothetical protein